MRYHHFTILFIIIFVVFGMRMQFSVSAYENASQNYADMERAFYKASDAAAAALCKYTKSGILTDKEEAKEAFFQSMYASLGILDSPAKRDELSNFIPMFAVLTDEGFYIYFEDEYIREDGYTYATRTWSECMPYSEQDENFLYRFTLDGLVTLYDKHGLIDGSIRVYEASVYELKNDPRYQNLRNSLPDSFLFDEEEYHTRKQTAVITSIQDAMRYFINEHNSTAKKNGYSYDFALPILDNSIWARSVSHPAVLVMIQGYPITAELGVYYNQYSFVGAQVYKDEPFYVTTNSWHPTYHRGNCTELLHVAPEVLLNPLYSVKDCVELGAYACEKCIHDGVYAPKKIYAPWEVGE